MIQWRVFYKEKQKKQKKEKPTLIFFFTNPLSLRQDILKHTRTKCIIADTVDDSTDLLSFHYKKMSAISSEQAETIGTPTYSPEESGP